MSVAEPESLVRELLRMLRHAPAAHYIELDSGGWADFDSVVLALRCARRAWSRLRADDLRDFLARQHADRFEWGPSRIRAGYGHSVATTDGRSLLAPPDVLFHGTQAAALPSILRDGLRAMGRQHVHLSSDIAYATNVAAVKGGQPILLTIRARAAHEHGRPYWRAGSHVWLTDEVPPSYLDVNS